MIEGYTTFCSIVFFSKTNHAPSEHKIIGIIPNLLLFEWCFLSSQFTNYTKLCDGFEKYTKQNIQRFIGIDNKFIMCIIHTVLLSSYLFCF